MASVYPDGSSKAQEALGAGADQGRPSDLPPPYVSSYPDQGTSKAFDSGAGFYQGPPGHPGYPPHVSAGYTSVPTGPGMIPADAILITQAPPQIIIQRESFVKQIVLSCVVFWLCCWPLGLVAFILALLANSRSSGPDEQSANDAHQLGVHSFRTSIAGLIIGTILITILIILNVVG